MTYRVNWAQRLSTRHLIDGAGEVGLEPVACDLRAEVAMLRCREAPATQVLRNRPTLSVSSEKPPPPTMTPGGEHTSIEGRVS